MDKKSIFQLGYQPIFKSFSDSLPVWGNPDLILYHFLRSIKFRVNVHFKHSAKSIVSNHYIIRRFVVLIKGSYVLLYILYSPIALADGGVLYLRYSTFLLGGESYIFLKVKSVEIRYWLGRCSLVFSPFFVQKTQIDDDATFTLFSSKSK